MEKRRLGNSDLHITSLGIGAWAMGGSGWRFSWGPQDDKDSVAAIRKALESGMNWIDTAAVYGLGHSKEVVAGAGVSHTGLIFSPSARAFGMSEVNSAAASKPNPSGASLRRV